MSLAVHRLCCPLWTVEYPEEILKNKPNTFVIFVIVLNVLLLASLGDEIALSSICRVLHHITKVMR